MISITGEKTNDSAVQYAVDEFSKAVDMPVNDYSIKPVTGNQKRYSYSVIIKRLFTDMGKTDFVLSPHL